MNQNARTGEVVDQPDYLARTPLYYLATLDPEVRASFTTHVPGPLARTGNVIAATVLLLGLNLLISLFILLLAYLVKSALGIDLFDKLHLLDFLKKFC